MSAYADLIERLQRQRLLSQRNIYALQTEAADAISRLEREKAELVGLLETAFSIINHTGVAAYLSARNLPLFCTAMDWVGEASPLLSRTQEPPHAHKDA